MKIETLLNVIEKQWESLIAALSDINKEKNEILKNNVAKNEHELSGQAFYDFEQLSKIENTFLENQTKMLLQLYNQYSYQNNSLSKDKLFEQKNENFFSLEILYHAVNISNKKTTQDEYYSSNHNIDNVLKFAFDVEDKIRNNSSENIKYKIELIEKSFNKLNELIDKLNNVSINSLDNIRISLLYNYDYDEFKNRSDSLISEYTSNYGSLYKLYDNFVDEFLPLIVKEKIGNFNHDQDILMKKELISESLNTCIENDINIDEYILIFKEADLIVNILKHINSNNLEACENEINNFIESIRKIDIIPNKSRKYDIEKTINIYDNIIDEMYELNKNDSSNGNKKISIDLLDEYLKHFITKKLNENNFINEALSIEDIFDTENRKHHHYIESKGDLIFQDNYINVNMAINEKLKNLKGNEFDVINSILIKPTKKFRHDKIPFNGINQKLLNEIYQSKNILLQDNISKFIEFNKDNSVSELSKTVNLINLYTNIYNFLEECSSYDYVLENTSDHLEKYNYNNYKNTFYFIDEILDKVKKLPNIDYSPLNDLIGIDKSLDNLLISKINESSSFNFEEFTLKNVDEFGCTRTNKDKVNQITYYMGKNKKNALRFLASNIDVYQHVLSDKINEFKENEMDITFSYFTQSNLFPKIKDTTYSFSENIYFTTQAFPTNHTQKLIKTCISEIKKQCGNEKENVFLQSMINDFAKMISESNNESIIKNCLNNIKLYYPRLDESFDSFKINRKDESVKIMDLLVSLSNKKTDEFKDMIDSTVVEIKQQKLNQIIEKTWDDVNMDFI